MFMYKTREIKYIYTKLKTLSNLVINAFFKKQVNDFDLIFCFWFRVFFLDFEFSLSVWFAFRDEDKVGFASF